MRVTRLITYTFATLSDMERNLGQMQPDGRRDWGASSMTIVTVPSTWGFWRIVRALLWK